MPLMARIFHTRQEWLLCRPGTHWLWRRRPTLFDTNQISFENSFYFKNPATLKANLSGGLMRGGAI
jgi:hypothetical protein